MTNLPISRDGKQRSHLSNLYCWVPMSVTFVLTPQYVMCLFASAVHPELRHSWPHCEGAGAYLHRPLTYFPLIVWNSKLIAGARAAGVSRQGQTTRGTLAGSMISPEPAGGWNLRLKDVLTQKTDTPECFLFCKEDNSCFILPTGKVELSTMELYLRCPVQ